VGEAGFIVVGGFGLSPGAGLGGLEGGGEEEEGEGVAETRRRGDAEILEKGVGVFLRGDAGVGTRVR